MPTFEITSPDGRKFRVEAPEGATQDDALAYVQQQQASPQAAEPQRRTLPQELGRQAGLGVRQVIEGAVSLPGIFIDPFQNLARSIANRPTLSSLIVPNKPSSIKTMSEATSDLLTRFGLPKEETGAEQLSGAISRGMVGGGGGAALARAIPAAAGAAPAAINNILAQNPLAQTVQAGIGAGASDVTRQAGGGPTAQMIAGAVAPMAATGAYGVAQAVGRGGRELVRPITQAGAEQIAADIVGKTTLDKKAALSNLDEYLARQRAGQTVGVPGSKPTAGAITGDYALIGAEQVASRHPLAAPEFAKRLAQNNEAFLNELSKLRATPEQVAAYVAKRDEVTAPLRDAAFANAKGPVDFTPVADEIVRLAKTPEGGRENSRRAIEWLTDRIKLYAKDGRTGPEYADALRMDIGDLVAGKISDEKGSVRLAAGLANEVKKVLTQQIELAAPGFKKYLETYARMSKPIERLEIIADQLGGRDLTRVTNSLPRLGEEGASYGLSQAKMRGAVDALDKKLPASKQGLPMAPYQRDVLGRVLGELNAQEVAARGGKQPGSDTYQNMASANFMTGLLGEGLAKAGLPQMLSKPINFLTSPLEPRIRDIINQSYLDPELMAKLLRMARTSRKTPTLGELATSAEQNIYGGLLGGAAAQR